MQFRGVLLLIVVYCTVFSLAKKRKAKPSQRLSSCSECILASPNYSWCSKAGHLTLPRCQNRSKTLASCGNDIVDPPENSVLIKKNVPLKRNRPISPQEMNITLRVGASVRLEITVFPKKRSVNLKLRYPRKLEVNVSSSCNGFKMHKKMVSCSRVPRREMVTLILDVKLKKCLPKPKKLKVIVEGKKKRALKVHVTSICACECDQPWEEERNSYQCSGGQGTYACGVCKCKPGLYGRYCECDASIIGPDLATDMCSLNGTVCSGRGECVCGQCECFTMSTSANKYSGRHCECDDYSCSYFDKELCGGPDRGVCRCGECHCLPDYAGEACELSLGTDNCMALSGLLCDGNGKCVHNQCYCTNGRMGPTCDDCPTCPGKCDMLRPCVECTVFNIGSLSQEECAKRCPKFNIMMVETIEEQDGMRLCQYRDDDSCLFRFTYVLERDIRTYVEFTRICPQP